MHTYYFFSRHKKGNNITIIEIVDTVKADSHFKAVARAKSPYVNFWTEWTTKEIIKEVVPDY